MVSTAAQPLDEAVDRRRHFHVQFDTLGGASPAESVSVLAGRAAITIALLVLSIQTLGAASHGTTTAWWLSAPSAAFAAIVGLWMLAAPRAIPLPVMDVLLVVADGMLVWLAAYLPAMQPAFPGIYLVMGCILCSARVWPIVLVHLALLGASYAGTLAVGPATS